MNDITALSQREKFEAWLEEAEALPRGYLKKRRTSDDAYHEPNTTDMWVAWQAASVEMVEEKAQGMEDYWKTQCRGIADHSEKLQAQIEQWEKLNAQFCSNADADISALRQRIIDLESCTVTVKLPEVRITIAESKLRNLTYQQLDAYNAGATRAAVKLSQVLAAAGIQVIEGE